tara:strand:+ start:178 stop:1671 length:1494 start_codon:yes stop_codon:yes gene_type:complete
MIDNLLTKHRELIKNLVFSFLFLSSLFMLKNNLQYNISKPHVDEIHTLNYGISSMYSGEVTNLRVGESTRWLARAIYPAALYYMNSKMGGVPGITSWRYPSGFYINKNYKSPKSIIGDPNLQDFTFAMKFILGALVLLSFLLASYKISKSFGFLSGILYFVFSSSTSLIIGMLSIFYTESSFIIIINLIISLALTKKVNVLRLYIWSSLLLALAISTKITGLIFAIPIIILILKRDSFIEKIKIEVFIISTILFIALINIYAISYMEVLDQSLSNVYHFKTGHKMTRSSSVYQFSKILESLSPWIFIFPVALSFLIYKKSRELNFLLSISMSSIIMIIGMIGVSYFLERNLTTPLIMMILIISVFFNLIIKFIKFKPKVIFIVSIIFTIFLHLFSVSSNLLEIDSALIKKSIKDSEKIAVIDVENYLLNGFFKLESAPETFNYFNDLQNLRNQFTEYDCVVIKRVKNNKHYTNYILPLDFSLASRFGDYFVFKKKSL